MRQAEADAIAADLKNAIASGLTAGDGTACSVDIAFDEVETE